MNNASFLHGGSFTVASETPLQFQPSKVQFHHSWAHHVRFLDAQGSCPGTASTPNSIAWGILWNIIPVLSIDKISYSQKCKNNLKKQWKHVLVFWPWVGLIWEISPYFLDGSAWISGARLFFVAKPQTSYFQYFQDSGKDGDFDFQYVHTYFVLLSHSFHIYFNF